MDKTKSIHSKQEIIEALRLKYEALLFWLGEQDKADLNLQKVKDKWTAAGHIDHLLKSTRPLNMALRLPLFVIKARVGVKNERKERTFDELVTKYKSKLQAGGRATGPYVPTKLDYSKTDLERQLKKEVKRLSKVINRWDEKKMSKYLLPHPLLGKLTIREMLFFTIYHTQHHLDLLKEQY